MEKIKYRAQVHQENLKGKFVWWEGREKNKGVFCSYSEMISTFELRMVLLTFLQWTYLDFYVSGIYARRRKISIINIITVFLLVLGLVNHLANLSLGTSKYWRCRFWGNSLGFHSPSRGWGKAAAVTAVSYAFTALMPKQTKLRNHT